MKQLFPFALNRKEPARKITDVGKHTYKVDGNDIIDLQSGNYSFILGFDNHELIDTVADKMKTDPFARFSMTNDSVLELNDKLGVISGYDSVFYSLSGSDAVETAIRACQLYHRKSERKHIIAYEESYHGSTYLTASLTGMEVFSHRLKEIPIENIHHIPQDNNPQTLLDKIDEIGGDNILAIVKEPVSWQSGLKPTSQEYYNTIREVCTQFDILFVLDEICTGICKTGEWFGFQRFDIDADIVCIGKGLTGGYFPLSATMFNEKVTKKLESTYLVNGWTHTPSMAGVHSANYVIDYIHKNDLAHRAYEIEEWTKQDFTGRHVGCFLAIDVSDMDTMQNAIDKMEKSGLLVTGYRYDPILRYAFPLNITKETYDRAIKQHAAAGIDLS